MELFILGTILTSFWVWNVSLEYRLKRINKRIEGLGLMWYDIKSREMETNFGDKP